MNEIYLQQLMSDYENPYSTSNQALITFLSYFWVDREKSESLNQWIEYVRESNLQARIILDQLKKVIKVPPSDLAQILEYHGGVHLYHYNPESETTVPYSLDESLAWLKKLLNELELIEKRERNSPEGVLRELLIKFWAGKTEDDAIQEWRKYLIEHRQESRLVLEKLAVLIENPPENLSKILWKYGRISLPNNHTSSSKLDEGSLQWVKAVLTKFSTCT